MGSSSAVRASQSCPASGSRTSVDASAAAASDHPRACGPGSRARSRHPWIVCAVVEASDWPEDGDEPRPGRSTSRPTNAGGAIRRSWAPARAAARPPGAAARSRWGARRAGVLAVGHRCRGRRPGRVRRPPRPAGHERCRHVRGPGQRRDDDFVTQPDSDRCHRAATTAVPTSAVRGPRAAGRADGRSERRSATAAALGTGQLVTSAKTVAGVTAGHRGHARRHASSSATVVCVDHGVGHRGARGRAAHADGGQRAGGHARPGRSRHRRRDQHPAARSSRSASRPRPTTAPTWSTCCGCAWTSPWTTAPSLLDRRRAGGRASASAPTTTTPRRSSPPRSSWPRRPTEPAAAPTACAACPGWG